MMVLSERLTPSQDAMIARTIRPDREGSGLTRQVRRRRRGTPVFEGALALRGYLLTPPVSR